MIRPNLPTLRRLAWAVALVVAVIIAGVVFVQMAGSKRVQTLRPIAVSTLGEGGDRSVILVLVEWHERDFCLGEFRVRAGETPLEVSISSVERVAPTLPVVSGCAGVETRDDRAAVTLHLKAPLADRLVIRSEDGTPIPVIHR